MKNTSRAGFTIVEPVIVIAVIAVLAALPCGRPFNSACGAQEAASYNLPDKTKKTIAHKSNCLLWSE